MQVVPSSFHRTGLMVQGLLQSPMDLALKVQMCALNQLSESVVKGIKAGVFEFHATLMFSFLVSAFKQKGPEDFQSASVDEYTRYHLDHPLQTLFVVPAIEELIFRGVIQSGIQKALLKLPKILNKNFQGPSENFRKGFSIITTSLLFSWAHFYNEQGWSHCGSALIKGLFYGSIHETKGFGASIPAHLTSNALATVVLSMM